MSKDKKTNEVSGLTLTAAVLVTLAVFGLPIFYWSSITSNEITHSLNELEAVASQPAPKAVLGDTVDQGGSCPTSGAIGANFGRNPDSYQTFVPSLNRLSKVSIPVSYEGLLAQQTYTLKIYQGGTIIVTKAITVNNPGSYTTAIFDFADVAVTPGQTYKLMLASSDTNAGSDWIMTTQNCANGISYSVWSGTSTQDYSFKTYGWNYTAPAAPAPAQTSTSTSRSTATNSTTTPAATTQNPTATTTTNPVETAQATEQEEEKAETTTEKEEPKTLVDSAKEFATKPLFFAILGVLLTLIAGFLGFYELKLKPKKK